MHDMWDMNYENLFHKKSGVFDFANSKDSVKKIHINYQVSSDLM